MYSSPPPFCELRTTGMTVTILETRPSTESENGVYDDSDGSRASVATSRQQTPDLVPLRDHSSGIMSASGSVSTDGLNSKSLPSDNNNVRSDSGDVSAVVDKAKKAALSLWILIHAQVSSLRSSSGRF